VRGELTADPSPSLSIPLGAMRYQVIRIGNQDRRRGGVNLLPTLCCHFVDERGVGVCGGRAIAVRASFGGSVQLTQQRGPFILRDLPGSDELGDIVLNALRGNDNGECDRF